MWQINSLVPIRIRIFIKKFNYFKNLTCYWTPVQFWPDWLSLFAWADFCSKMKSVCCHTAVYITLMMIKGLDRCYTVTDTKHRPCLREPWWNGKLFRAVKITAGAINKQNGLFTRVHLCTFMIMSRHFFSNQGGFSSTWVN